MKFIDFQRDGEQCKSFLGFLFKLSSMIYRKAFFIFLSKFNFKFKRLRLFLLNYLRKRINDEAKRIRLCRGTVCVKILRA